MPWGPQLRSGKLRAVLDDPASRAEVGAAAAKRVRERHSLAAYTSRMREIYRESLDIVRPASRD